MEFTREKYLWNPREISAMSPYYKQLVAKVPKGNSRQEESFSTFVHSPYLPFLPLFPPSSTNATHTYFPSPVSIVFGTKGGSDAQSVIRSKTVLYSHSHNWG